tara:strand:- start:439 stop:849 length:411 start_codon:yes stop_codon:yes gene_type:complete
MSRFFKYIFGVIILVSLNSCVLTPDEPEPEIIYKEKPLVHPRLPDATAFRYSDPFIVTKEKIAEMDDNIVLQCFEYDDGQDVAIDMERAMSYIRELTAVLCSYRKELDEPRCAMYNNSSNNSEKESTDGEEVQSKN